jgi:hypothetical protein
MSPCSANFFFFLPRYPLTMILQISASWVARITDVSHSTQLLFFFQCFKCVIPQHFGTPSFDKKLAVNLTKDLFICDKSRLFSCFWDAFFVSFDYILSQCVSTWVCPDCRSLSFLKVCRLRLKYQILEIWGHYFKFSFSLLFLHFSLNIS